MTELTLKIDLVNKVLGYLGTRPYAEVAEMIGNIQYEYAQQAREKEVHAAEVPASPYKDSEQVTKSSIENAAAAVKQQSE